MIRSKICCSLFIQKGNETWSVNLTEPSSNLTVDSHQTVSQIRFVYSKYQNQQPHHRCQQVITFVKLVLNIRYFNQTNFEANIHVYVFFYLYYFFTKIWTYLLSIARK